LICPSLDDGAVRHGRRVDDAKMAATCLRRWPCGSARLRAIATGTLAGFLNGALINGLKLPPSSSRWEHERVSRNFLRENDGQPYNVLLTTISR